MEAHDPSAPRPRLLSGFVPGYSWPGGRPLRVMLDTTNRCNIRCVMCHFAYPAVWEESLQSWSLEFLAIVEREVLRHACQAQLSLGTEPLVWKHFPELLDACRRAGVPHIEMYTNALLLTEELAEKIVTTPMARLEISLEGATREGFESVRVGGSFERFLRGIRHVTAAKARHRSTLPRLQFNVTLLRKNAHEVEDIVRLAKELGVEDLDFRHVVVHDDLGMEEQSFLNDRPGYNALMARVRKLAADLGLRIVIQPDDFDLGASATAAPAAAFALPPPRKLPECWAPWRQILIRADGSVVPCPFWYTADTMGNLHRQSFMEIWEGAPFRRLREELLTGDYHQNCAQCPLRGIGKVDEASSHRSHNLAKGQFEYGTGIDRPAAP